MDVTKHNFVDILQSIQDLIRDCDFIAFDLEMSGISLDKPQVSDSSEMRYSKLSRAASSFLVIQMGICFFTKTSDDTFAVHPFNFHLFPGDGSGVGRKTFLSSCSSLSFLAEHGMDFNKWVRDGIPFISKGDEQYFRDRFMHQKKDSWRSKKISLKDDSELGKVHELMEGFDDWVQSEQTEFTFKPCNPYFRRYIYEDVQARFPDISMESKVSSEDPEKYIVASKLSEDEKVEREAEAAQVKEKQLRERMGFRNLFVQLMESRKPMVGHNCLMDLMFMYNAFHLPLPDTFVEFKQQLLQCFPAIYDTKLMAQQKSHQKADGATFFSKTALGQLFETVKTEASQTSQTVFPNLPRLSFHFSEESQNYLSNSSEAFHDAGFDAFITGFIFAHLRDQMDDTLVNKVAIQRMVFEHIDLEGEEKLGEDHCFFEISGFPVDTTTDDLINSIMDEDITKEDLRVFWVDDNQLIMRTSIEKAEKLFKATKNARITMKVQKLDLNTSTFFSNRPNKRRRTTS